MLPQLPRNKKTGYACGGNSVTTFHLNNESFPSPMLQQPIFSYDSLNINSHGSLSSKGMFSCQKVLGSWICPGLRRFGICSLNCLPEECVIPFPRLVSPTAEAVHEPGLPSVWQKPVPGIELPTSRSCTVRVRKDLVTCRVIL